MFTFKQSLAALFAFTTLLAFAGERPAFGQDSSATKENVNAQKTKDTASEIYSAYVEVDSPGERVCTPIPVPEGMRLVIETVEVDARLLDDITDIPRADLFSQLNRGGFLFGSRLQIPLTPRPFPTGSVFHQGHVRTRLVSGPVTVGDGVVSFFLCAGASNAQGFAARARVDGFIVGHLLPL